MSLKVVICANGSHAIGMGHLYRAVNLATNLRSEGISEIALFSQGDDQACAWLRGQDICAEILSESDNNAARLVQWLKANNPQVLVNDLLDTEVEYMRMIVGCAGRTINLDDNGPGALLADYCINALPCRMRDLDGENNLQGPRYQIISEDFYPPQRRIVSAVPTSLLVTMGGSDTYGNTVLVAKALLTLRNIDRIEVVVGASFQQGDELAQLVTKDPRFTVKRNVLSLGERMRIHELAIVGGGITVFEAAASALPTMSIASEDFECQNIEWAQSKGITYAIGHRQSLSVASIQQAVRSLLQDEKGRQKMALMGPKVIDGKGRERIVSLIKDLCN